MPKLFNTPFEAGLRAMLILYSVGSRGMTLDRIVAYDFITLYGKDFGVSAANLHGQNPFNFSELSAKRATCSDGIKAFVLDGLISVTQTQYGFIYSITKIGNKYVKALESDYKRQYLEILKTVHKKYDSVSDATLVNMINTAGVTALRRQP